MFYHTFTSFSSVGQKVLQTCPSLTKLLPILHILGDCCTDSLFHYFFRGLKSIGISLPLPLSGKCKMLCELLQSSVVHLRLPAQCQADVSLPKSWEESGACDLVHTLSQLFPQRTWKCWQGCQGSFLPKSKSGFSLESAQWGAHLVSCVTEKSKLFLARVVCVRNMLSILLVRAHHFDEIKCDICSNFKQLNQC